MNNFPWNEFLVFPSVFSRIYEKFFAELIHNYFGKCLKVFFSGFRLFWDFTSLSICSNPSKDVYDKSDFFPRFPNFSTSFFWKCLESAFLDSCRHFSRYSSKDFSSFTCSFTKNFFLDFYRSFSEHLLKIFSRKNSSRIYVRDFS